MKTQVAKLFAASHNREGNKKKRFKTENWSFVFK